MLYCERMGHQFHRRDGGKLSFNVKQLTMGYMAKEQYVFNSIMHYFYNKGHQSIGLGVYKVRMMHEHLCSYGIRTVLVPKFVYSFSSETFRSFAVISTTIRAPRGHSYTFRGM